MEAGSGENTLSSSWISNILTSQASALLNCKTEVVDKKLNDLESGTRVIVPGSIYGGGITTTTQLQNVLGPSQNGVKIVPELVIVGNISEQNVSTTYDLVDEINSINQVPAISIDSLQ